MSVHAWLHRYRSRGPNEVAARWNGTSWLPEQLPVSHGGAGGIWALSCSSLTACVGPGYWATGTCAGDDLEYGLIRAAPGDRRRQGLFGRSDLDPARIALVGPQLARIRVSVLRFRIVVYGGCLSAIFVERAAMVEAPDPAPRAVVGCFVPIGHGVHRRQRHPPAHDAVEWHPMPANSCASTSAGARSEVSRCERRDRVRVPTASRSLLSHTRSGTQLRICSTVPSGPW